MRPVREGGRTTPEALSPHQVSAQSAYQGIRMLADAAKRPVSDIVASCLAKRLLSVDSDTDGGVGLRVPLFALGLRVH